MKSPFNLDEIKKIADKIDGWLWDKEGEFLYETAKKCTGKGVIVEIGSWKGKSTVYLGGGSKSGKGVKIFAIDPHIGSLEHQKKGPIWTFEEFKENIKMANVDDVIEPIVKTSQAAEKDFGQKPVEFLWIDGDHKYQSVKLDFDIWLPHLIEGGIIAFHDTIFYEGPKKVVIDNIYKSRNFADINLIGSTVAAKKMNQNTLKDRIKNRRSLFSRYFYSLFLKIGLYLPRPIKNFGKKLMKF